MTPVPPSAVFIDQTASGNRDCWAPGERAFFEYHCWESLESKDAPAWLRSHQEVSVLGRDDDDADDSESFDQRAENGQPKAYRVRFDDGLEWTALEDELFVSSDYFVRPAPPAMSGVGA